MFDSKFARISGGALIAAAAGMAAALLFVLAARGSLVTMALGYFAPLPIMVACLSYGLMVGTGAALVGAAFLAAVFHPLLALLFAVVIGAPAAIIAAAALLAPQADPPTNRDDAAVAKTDKRDGAPTMAVLAAALCAAASIAAAIALLAWRLGGYEALVAQAISEGAPIVKQLLGETPAPASLTADDLTRYLVWFAPVAMAASELIMLIVNLWLAGRAGVISGNLPRPWPAISDNLALPPLLGATFALACGLIFVGGLPGLIAAVLAAAFGAAFALQGLAVAHTLTRGSGMRFSLLFALYALVLLIPPWPFCLLAIVGLVDVAFHLRTRLSASSRSKKDLKE